MYRKPITHPMPAGGTGDFENFLHGVAPMRAGVMPVALADSMYCLIFAINLSKYD
jgi:hypothetical protein